MQGIVAHTHNFQLPPLVSIPHLILNQQNSGRLVIETKEETPQTTHASHTPYKPSVPKKPKKKTSRKKKRGVKLWEFLVSMLMSPRTNPSMIRWSDRAQGLFIFEDPELVAKLWGKAKNNCKMNYEKMSRCIRLVLLD